MFLAFLSFPLLGFPVTSSRLLTWSLSLSVPRFFVPGWFVLRPLRWCPPSPPVHRLSLGWPPRSISLLQLSLLLCPLGGLGSSSFPPARLWSSRLAFRSVTVPLVFSWLPPFSPQFVCGFSRVSASWHAPAFRGALPSVSLFCVFGCLGSVYFLASSPAPPVSSGLVVVFPLGGLLLYGCIGSLIPRSSAVVLSSVVCLQSSFPALVVVLFIPPSSFRTPSVSVGCVPSAFAMGSP